MKKKKSTHNKESNLKQNLIFCSECGEELELFGIDGKAVDVQKVKERHANCKKVGRFKGDKCAMLFIAESNESLFQQDEED
jgi:hypothetical protein